jgi:glycosyltransferase involved in cell wall biosynthesis
MRKHTKIVVHIVQHLIPGGIEVLALNMLKEAQENTFIISLEGCKTQSLSNWPDLTPYKNRIFFMDKGAGVSLKTLIKLSLTLKRLNADIVHTHHIGPLFYGGASAKILSKSVVHTEHDAWHLNNQRSYQLQKKLLYLLKPKVVADAVHVGTEFKRLFPDIDPTIIHNGIDTEKFKPFSKTRARQYLSLPKTAKLIGCAARLENVKGHNILISAFAQLQDKDTYLILAGSGSLKIKLQHHAKILGVEKRVIFLGHVSNMNMFYNAIDVFCLASYQEGFPLSPLEAQACGLPCVLTDVGGCRETVSEKSGVLVEAGNVHSLAKGLVEALKPQDTKAIREFIEKHADITIMNHKYQEVYVC